MTGRHGGLEAPPDRRADSDRPLGNPEAEAGPVAWLLSDDARYVAGAIVPVGGYLAR
jgi:NAD(P)-dependent dehydrogenase (short-subunit alcohol dehydrogenase family)